MVIFIIPFLIFLATTGLVIPITISLTLRPRGYPSEQSLFRLPVDKTQGVVLAAPSSQNGVPASRWKELGRHVNKLGLPPWRRVRPIIAVSRVTNVTAGCRLLLEADDATSAAKVSQHPSDAAAGGLVP
jgi:ABC-type anion transport system duplicated permease subunit